MFKKSVAVRENVKLKIGLSGPSGSGKTYSALQLAYGIAGDWSKVAVVDTENRSALYYADLGKFTHIPFDPDEIPGGYDPRNWVKVIQFAESDPATEVLVLDSISHEWEGKGGCLEINTKLGGRYTDWAKVTPLHQAFLDAMRLSRLHIIACMRTKQDYVVEQNEKGKATPRKVGLKAVQREGADYEFGLVFDIGMNHFASSSKDRTGLFMPRGDFQITPATGKELLEWSTSAKEPEQRSAVVVPIESAEFWGVPYDSADPKLKVHLCGRLTKMGITNKTDWGTISGLMKGRPMEQLDSVVDDWRNAGDTAE